MRTGILFEEEDKLDKKADYVHDLHLDMIEKQLSNYVQTSISEYFYSPAKEIDEVKKRQNVFKDLKKKENFELFYHFYKGMASLYQEQEEVEKMRNDNQKFISLFNNIYHYIDLVEFFEQKLEVLTFNSSRLKFFQEKVIRYSKEERFLNLKEQFETLAAEMDDITYGVLVEDNVITIQELDSNKKNDYSYVIQDTFADFLEPKEDFPFKLPNSYSMLDSFQEMVLDQVVELYRNFFERLKQFVQKNQEYMADFFAIVYQELGFYLSYIQMMDSVKEISFTFPELTQENSAANEIIAGKDLVLALRLAKDEEEVVPNDFYFDENSFLNVVTGPNQGGKTTFARMVGQIYYLVRLGVMVPAKRATLTLVSSIYTHFERAESESLTVGKLEDDIRRVHNIMNHIDKNSLIIANELFSSTTKKDAVQLSQKIIGKIKAKGARMIFITFLEEITHLEEADTYVSLVDKEDPDRRLFKIVRQEADNRAYTASLVKKYQINQQDIVRRLTQ